MNYYLIPVTILWQAYEPTGTLRFWVRDKQNNEWVVDNCHRVQNLYWNIDLEIYHGTVHMQPSHVCTLIIDAKGRASLRYCFPRFNL